jgi:Fe2+ or Zn2+ uptake regulation protein
VRRQLEDPLRHDWSLDDLVEALRRDGVSADYSSVFRAVAYLEGEGVVRRVAVGDTKLRFELTGEHHDHVRCEACGRVAEVPECHLDAVQAGIEAATGFAVSGHDLTFSGLCPRCR